MPITITHNPKSPQGDRGNGLETQPGGEWKEMYHQTNDPHCTSVRGGGQISYGDTVKEIVKQLLTDNLSLAFAMCYKRTLSIYESELF